MTKIQLSNFNVLLDDEKLRFSNASGTWAMEVSIISPRYMILSNLVMDETMHEYLERYIRINYLISEAIFLDKPYINDIFNAYNNLVIRYDEKFGKKKNR